jgi:hypothetical protein
MKPLTTNDAFDALLRKSTAAKGRLHRARVNRGDANEARLALNYAARRGAKGCIEARREQAIQESLVAWYNRRIARLAAVCAGYDAALAAYVVLERARWTIRDAVAGGERKEAELAAVVANADVFELAVGTLLDAGVVASTVIQVGDRFCAGLRTA